MFIEHSRTKPIDHETTTQSIVLHIGCGFIESM
jgi:hypothetical protein